MPTIKAVLRPPKDKDGKKPIYIRISDAGKTRYVSTGEKVKPGLWIGDTKSDKWVRENDAFEAAHLNQIISDRIKAINDEAYQLKADNQNVNADILKKKAKSKEYRGSFIEYGKTFAQRKRRANVRTGKRYDAVLSKLEEYTGGKLQFKDITVTWLKELSDWLADEKDNSPNTIHSNLKCIRAILYEAIRENQFPQEKNPFFNFKLKQPKVSRVKLSADEIKALATVKTNDNPVQQMA
ncbi:MAG: phage integrase SAM-like domain and Arm DNA-binding domain-containing protein, partial [Balneolaceae bacterium]